MTFDDVYNTTALGVVLRVADGKAAPPQSAAFRYACWRSHNFTGPLLEKRPGETPGSPRALVIEDQDAPCKHRAYEVREDVDHTFELAS